MRDKAGRQPVALPNTIVISWMLKPRKWVRLEEGPRRESRYHSQTNLYPCPIGPNCPTVEPTSRRSRFKYQTPPEFDALDVELDRSSVVEIPLMNFDTDTDEAVNSLLAEYLDLSGRPSHGH